MSSVFQLESVVDDHIKEFTSELNTRYALTGKRCNLSEWAQWRKSSE
jgi:hypothetical protein